MFATTARRQIAAILCTAVMSTACVVSAVGPATATAQRAAPTQTVA